MILGFVRKNKLKKEIYKDFLKAIENNDWIKIDILSKRYIRVCDVKTKIY
jgi:hypothetical protein